MINIDSRSSKPIFEQIVDAIKESIIKGLLKPGDKLPSVRELSVEIMVNHNTVSKAYIELERQRVIETVKGRGTFVPKDYRPKVDEYRMEKLKEAIKNIIIESHYLGINKRQVIRILEEIYKEFERK